MALQKQQCVVIVLIQFKIHIIYDIVFGADH